MVVKFDCTSVLNHPLYTSIKLPVTLRNKLIVYGTNWRTQAPFNVGKKRKKIPSSLKEFWGVYVGSQMKGEELWQPVLHNYKGELLSLDSLARKLKKRWESTFEALKGFYTHRMLNATGNDENFSNMMLEDLNGKEKFKKFLQQHHSKIRCCLNDFNDAKVEQEEALDTKDEVKSVKRIMCTGVDKITYEVTMSTLTKVE